MPQSHPPSLMRTTPKLPGINFTLPLRTNRKPAYSDFSLHHHFSGVSRDTKPIVEYLHEIHSLSDELATAGSPINNKELVVKIWRDNKSIVEYLHEIHSV